MEKIPSYLSQYKIRNKQFVKSGSNSLRISTILSSISSLEQTVLELSESK